MKTDWEIKTLGEVCTLQRGFDLPTNERAVGGFPLVSSSGISDKIDLWKVKAPGVVTGRSGSIGKIFFIEQDFWPLNTTLYVKNYHGNYPRFIYHLLNQFDLSKYSSGAGVPTLNRNSVHDELVLVPKSLAEQQRIVAILDEAFAALDRAKANAETNLQNARALFTSYLQSVFANPGEGWQICKIEDCVKFVDYRGKTPDKTPAGMRLITAKNVKLGYLQRSPEEFVNPEIYNSWMTRGIPKIGDVLFTTEAPLANVAQLDTDEKVAFAQRIIILQPQTKKLANTFLKYLLLSQPIRERIIQQGTGATVQGIKASLLKKTEIYFPPLAEQQTIVAKLDALSVETKKLEAIYAGQLVALAELRKSILARAFEGALSKTQGDALRE